MTNSSTMVGGALTAGGGAPSSGGAIGGSGPHTGGLASTGGAPIISGGASNTGGTSPNGTSTSTSGVDPVILKVCQQMAACGDTNDPNAMTWERCTGLTSQTAFFQGPHQASDLEPLFACASLATNCTELRACFSTPDGSFAGPVIYVAPPPLGDDDSSGLAPASPKATLRSALAIAQASSTIRLAAGTYAECLWLFRAIRLEGSFSLDFATRTIEDMSAIIDTEGLDCQPIAVMSGFPNLDFQFIGLTATNGRSTATDPPRTDEGGAIYVSNGNALLDHVKVSHSFATDDGGGLAAYNGAHVTIIDSVIESNSTAGNAGAGLTCGGATFEIQRSQFIGNHGGEYGGAMNFWDCTATITSSSVVSNTTGTAGGGIMFGGSGQSTYALGTTTFSENSPNAGVGAYADLGGNVFE